MNKKGVIFDLDGVIVNTAKYHFLAWRKLANDLGFDFSEEQNEQLKGVSREDSLKKILEWGGVELSEDEFYRQMDLKNKNYLSYVERMDEEDILPGVIEVLEYLTRNEVPFALASASKNARTILEKIHLLNTFDTIVDGTDISKAKPDPEVFLIAAERLRVAPIGSIVFEDALAGVQAANNANMISIGIGNKKNLYEADYVINDLSELKLGFLEKLLNKD